MAAVLGLDLSSTATGICCEPGIFGHERQTWTISPKGALLYRARQMRTSAKIAAQEPTADLVVVEAIATRHTQTAIAIATVHALVLDAIADDYRVLTVSPAELKKFATGKGNADKTAMLLAAKREGWIDPPGATDDQADAWWLWVLGHAALGTWHVPQTAYRTAVIDGITIPGGPK